MTNQPQDTNKPAASPATPRPAASPVPRRPFGPRRHFAPRRKVCRLCVEKIDAVDYKQVQIVKSFCADGGKILSRRITGACTRHQRQLARAVKINRNLAILPYSG